LAVKGRRGTGGHWNSRGLHVVYASATQSLAVLESLVHLNFPIVFPYAFFRIEFPETLADQGAIKTLPRDWQTHPPSGSTQKIGDLWKHEARSAILAVPSAVVPAESNDLINPAHSDFKKIKISDPVP